MSESPSSHSPTSPSPHSGASPSPSRASQPDQIRDRGDAGYNKSLKNRHLQMIAIGGSIGTGLFMGAGGRLKEGGAELMFAYAVCGIFAFLMVRALGELAIRRPSSGAFVSYAREFLGEKGAYITGWFFFLDWSVTVMADITAVANYLHYWTALKVVPQWVFALIALVLVFILNMLNVKMFGEAEFWLAAIKVVIVIVFVISGVFMIAGLMGDNSPGLSNWTIGDAPFHNGFVGVIAVFMIAGFSFQGTELVGVAAGESENPRRDVPRSIRTVFWRIMFFYIGAIAVIGTLLPYTDPSLLSAADDSANNIAQSPFTLVFARMGIGAAAAVMNAVILTSILSAGNSGLYAASRMLHSMALKRQAPAIFARVTKGGVPAYAMAVTTVTAALGFLTQLVFNDAYIWLVNIVGISGIIIWLGIAVSHIRFRRAYLLQGYRLEDLPYRSPFFPAGPIIAFVMCLVVMAGQNYEAVLHGQVWEVASSYIGLPLFGVVWWGYHVARKDRVVPLAEMDVAPVEIEPVTR